MTTTLFTPAPSLDPHLAQAHEATTRGSISRHGAGLIAGVGYVLLFGLTKFANFFAREGMVVAAVHGLVVRLNQPLPSSNSWEQQGIDEVLAR